MCLVVDMRHVNEWIDVPGFVFKGLHNFNNLMSKGDDIYSYDLTTCFSHVKLHRLQESSLGFDDEEKHICF
jgi:hypothetical protein